jgi:hypothetical protein
MKDQHGSRSSEGRRGDDPLVAEAEPLFTPDSRTGPARRGQLIVVGSDESGPVRLSGFLLRSATRCSGAADAAVLVGATIAVGVSSGGWKRPS